jgi:hypothetical protein
MTTSVDDSPCPEEPDDAILADPVEQPESNESGGEREPPSDDDYVPV